MNLAEMVVAVTGASVLLPTREVTPPEQVEARAKAVCEVVEVEVVAETQRCLLG